MKKQTSVEWFNQQIVDKQNGNGDLRSWDEIFEQAKEMEHEQIVKAWEYGCMTNYGDAETYYNETYKGGEQ